MPSLLEFAKIMRDRAKRFSINTDQAIKKIALDVDKSVVLATPVDTGRARANWQASINSPIDTVSSDSDSSGGKTISQAQAAIATYRSGDTIHITNNLPYIKRLNEGWSKQAPAGFVDKAVQTAGAQLKAIRLLSQ